MGSTRYATCTFKIILFGIEIAALYHLKHPILASGLAIIIVVNRVLMFIWNQ
ncbi:hypothetical protein bcgnr5380_05010 [Bacillus cereus]